MGKCVSCKLRRYCRRANYRSVRVKKLTCKRPGGRSCVKKGSTSCDQCEEPLDDYFKKGKKMSIEELISTITTVESQITVSDCISTSTNGSDCAMTTSTSSFKSIISDDNCSTQSYRTASSNSFNIDSLDSDDDARVEELLYSISSIETQRVTNSATSELSSSTDDSLDDFELLPNPDEVRKERNHIDGTLCDMIMQKDYGIDHPVCDNCLDSLLEALETEIKDAEEDFIDYCKYLAKLETEAITPPPYDELKTELGNLQSEEERLLADFEAMQEKEIETLKEIRRLKKETQELNKIEESYAREYSTHCKSAFDLEDEYKSVETQLNYVQSRLKLYKTENVFQTLFNIWHQGEFGTINSFRMGRLPSETVSWSEINIAWGQAALLLSALARKANIAFKKYNIVPYGDHSYIEIESEKRIVPLFGAGGTRFVWNTEVDNAMAAFLKCMRQVERKLREDGEKMILPYFIRNGRLIDPGSSSSYSIKTQFNSGEEWTKALKFMLTNLKWCISYVNSKFKDNNDESEDEINKVPN